MEWRLPAMATPDTAYAQFVVRDLVDQEIFGSRHRENKGGLVFESHLSAHARENQKCPRRATNACKLVSRCNWATRRQIAVFPRQICECFGRPEEKQTLAGQMARI